MSFDLKDFLKKERQRIDEALDHLLPEPIGPNAKVIEAMRYSVSAGGKRVRPILMRSACRCVSGDPDAILPAACAMECIHTYSLIHDDLPAMDDDDLRRGKPTCHKVFGEALAILAGDGLLTIAFSLMTDKMMTSGIGAEVVLEAVGLLADAAGVAGMVGGQTADILNEGRKIDAQTLAYIHSAKTGALIKASVTLGAMLGGGDRSQIEALSQYGSALGLCFQIVDDLLDVVGDESRMGKPVGSDERKAKATYPALFGLDETRRRARDLRDQALSSLEAFGPEADPLRAIANYIVERDR